MTAARVDHSLCKGEVARGDAVADVGGVRRGKGPGRRGRNAKRPVRLSML
jgi:hypothetical protein